MKIKRLPSKTSFVILTVNHVTYVDLSHKYSWNICVNIGMEMKDIFIASVCAILILAIAVIAARWLYKRINKERETIYDSDDNYLG